MATTKKTKTRRSGKATKVLFLVGDKAFPSVEGVLESAQEGNPSGPWWDDVKVLPGGECAWYMSLGTEVPYEARLKAWDDCPADFRHDILTTASHLAPEDDKPVPSVPDVVEVAPKLRKAKKAPPVVDTVPAPKSAQRAKAESYVQKVRERRAKFESETGQKPDVPAVLTPQDLEPSPPVPPVVEVPVAPSNQELVAKLLVELEDLRKEVREVRPAQVDQEPSFGMGALVGSFLLGALMMAILCILGGAL